MTVIKVNENILNLEKEFKIESEAEESDDQEIFRPKKSKDRKRKNSKENTKTQKIKKI